jgi:transposase
MKASSLDLRQKILRACHQGLTSQRAMATLFGVSLSVVEKLLRRRRTTGDIAPCPHAEGRRPSGDEAALAQIRRLVHEPPDATRAECCEWRWTRQRRRVRMPTMARLVPPETAATKTSLHASERGTARVQPAPAASREAVAPLAPRCLKCMAESGVTFAMTRLDGRAPRGERVIGAVPQHDGAHVTCGPREGATASRR